MQRYSESTVMFDERFIDYGCNKVQYIDHLRNLGRTFYIITQSFAMDVAHHEQEVCLLFVISSNLRKKYINTLHRGHKPRMQLACFEYMAILDSRYRGIPKTNLCRSQSVGYKFPVLKWNYLLQE